MTAEELLVVVRSHGLDLTVEGGELVIRGRGLRPADVMDEVVTQAGALTRLLTTCARCGDVDPIRLIEAYWGHQLCPTCCADVVGELNATDAWPQVDWPNGPWLAAIAPRRERTGDRTDEP
jgi:hypothetical protein